ncbi:hypothetical protein ABZ412_13785 [Nocardia sp. NPDC005746]|uniref:hypothetical protein n=1 Tax=Nocardia sp. NPDC005746 TaxID=3157062 RepID=UPI0033F0B601
MASDVTTGLFTLAGALIGGGGTFAVNWATTRNQRLLALAARDHSILDRQYAEHREYLLRADRVIEATRTVAAALEAGQSGETADRFHTEYLALWPQFSEGRGAPELAGPEELIRPLLGFHAAIADYSNKVDEWWSEGFDSPNHTANSIDCGKLREEVSNKRYIYREQALKAFGHTNSHTHPR